MDPQSIESVRREQVFEVGSCWNGVVVFRAGLVAYEAPSEASEEQTDEDVAGTAGNGTSLDLARMVPSGLRKRGWQMVDNGASCVRIYCGGGLMVCLVFSFAAVVVDGPCVLVLDSPGSYLGSVTCHSPTGIDITEPLIPFRYSLRPLASSCFFLASPPATDPQSRHSPPVQLPLSFRTSHLDACDHSECCESPVPPVSGHALKRPGSPVQL